MALQAQVFKGEGRQPWRFRLVNTGNHRVMTQSEGYISKWNAKRAARRAFSDVEVVDVS